MQSDPQLEPIRRFADQVLAQAQALAQSFAECAPQMYAAQVGPHLRHAIEHFAALLAPTDAAVVAYDARKRDAQLSACPVTAVSALAGLRRLLRLQHFVATAPVRVVGVAGLTGDSGFACPSTFGRELMYVGLHAIHHFALVKSHCIAAGVALPPNFGVAPATVQFESVATPAERPPVDKPEGEPGQATQFKGLPRRALLLLGVASLFGTATAMAAPAINTLTGGFLGRRSDTAILGYDTVAYFTDGKPVKGSDAFVAEWMGAKWKFASQAHLDLFKSNPERYAPQYGGYCAYGVSQGNLVGIEPDKFTIIEGKLYLNYDASVQAIWLKDPAGFNRHAAARFPALLKQ